MPTNNKTQKLVPELRFPEFREDGEWVARPLGDFLKEHKVKSDAKSEVHSVSVHKGVINQKEHLGRSYAANDTSNYNLAHPNDVIYTKSPTGEFPYGIVKQSHLAFNVIVSPLYGVYTPITAAVGYIVDCFFESPQRAYKYLDPITQKGAKNTIQITNQGFLTGVVQFPSYPPEQQKIADCLGSLDELLAAHRRKLAALQDHKKGLLQQLFPSVEGASSSPTRKQREQDAPTTIQTTPNLRFPGFEGEWESVSLGEIADIKLGKMLDRKKHTSGRLLPYLNNLSVRWGKVETADLPRMFFNDNELERYGLKAEDVLVCEGGEPGRSAVWDGRLPEMKYQKAVHRVRFRIRFNPHLLVHYLEAIAGTPQLEMLFTGGGIKHLTRETFSKLTIPLPNPPEQQKIADCLSALDALITAQTGQISALKAHKKGLMQKLFPTRKALHDAR